MKRTLRNLLIATALGLLVVGCQGPVGLVSRIEAPRLVSPFNGAWLACQAAAPPPSPPPSPAPSPSPSPAPYELSWTKVRGVAFYHVEIYRRPDNILVVTRRVDPDEVQDIQVDCATEYLWRVAAVAEYPADPAWSDLWWFALTEPVGTTTLRARAK